MSAFSNHLLELSVRTQQDLGDVSHGGCHPLQHAPELRVEGHVLRSMPELPDIGVHYKQRGPGSLHLSPVHTESPCSTETDLIQDDLSLHVFLLHILENTDQTHIYCTLTCSPPPKYISKDMWTHQG